VKPTTYPLARLPFLNPLTVPATLHVFTASEKGGTQPLRLSADSLDLGEGQSVVFGKSNVHESGDVVVVVLTARVVN
jgi:hypothetical protein